MDAVHVSLDIPETLTQTDDSKQIEGTGFETERIFHGLKKVVRIEPRATEPGRNQIKIGADDQTADAGGAEQGFVAGKGKSLDIHLPHIDGNASSALGCIDDKGNPL